MKKVGIKCVATVLLMGLFTGQPNAQEPTFGSGVMASKCSKLLAGIKEGNGLKQPLAFAMLSWTEGYITATNLSIGEEKGATRFDLGSTTATEIWASLFGYCKRNPDQLGVAAAIHTMTNLSRIKTE